MMSEQSGPDSDISAEDQTSGVNGNAVLLVVAIPTFFTVLNASAVVVLLPEIGADLNVGSTSLSWLMSGFLLIYGIAIPFFGRLADIYGARRFFMAGMLLFSLGSLLAALAPTYEFLLGARVVQALDGAAIPGLGMTLASRAFAPGNRGAAFGVLSATLGAGAAVGPLLGGAMSEAFGWQSLFAITALGALVTPLAYLILPKAEESSREPLDVPGGVLLALVVSGLLLAATGGGQSGWGSSLVLGAVTMSAVALLLGAFRQRSAPAPFLPRELLAQPRYLALLSTSFLAMAVNLGFLVALPLVLTTRHDLSIGQVGLILLPGALATGVLGLIAGRMVDRVEARLPVRIGISLMLLATLGLSTFVGSEIWQITIFVVALGAGFALLNTPIAAVISLVVRAQMLPSALSINTMILFLGGSFSAAFLTLILSERGGPGISALNPLHTGLASDFSDAFLILSPLMLVAMALSLALPAAPEPTEEEAVAVVPRLAENQRWGPICTVPWMPQCEEATEGEEAARAAGIIELSPPESLESADREQPAGPVGSALV